MRALVFAAALAASLPARAEETVVVIGGESAAYKEALEGFRKEFREGFEVRQAGDPRALPSDARVVVAIGGRAAIAGYPADATLVVCLAPALSAASVGHRGAFAEVGMLPPPRRLLEALLKTAAPGRRLAVAWSSPSFSQYAEDLSREAGDLGASVRLEHVSGDEELLGALRALRGAVDALWVPPDPLFADAARLKTLEATTAQWKIKLLGSTPGFVKYGAYAIVGASFESVGHAAARAARDALDDRLAPRYYPSDVEVKR